MTVNGPQQNMKKSCVKHPKHGKSKVEASQAIQLFHLDHIQKRHRLCVFFQMFTNLSGRMQPVLKKAPLSAGRRRPKAFYSDSEPPRIGTTPVQHPPPPKPVNTWDVQPQGMFRPLTATPMTTGKSTYRGTSKANADRDESGDTQASIASTSSTGSA